MRQSKTKTVIGKILDVPILIGCLAAIAVFCFIAYHGILGSMELYNLAQGIGAKMFYVGILVAILWACLGFIELSVKWFAQTFRHLFTKG